MPRAEYVERKFRQTVMPLLLAAGAASFYILVSLAEWLFGDGALIRGGLFRFCIVAVGFTLVFYLFARLVRGVVIRAITE